MCFRLEDIAARQAQKMTFAQLHERVRVEVLRRIKRGVLTATLLAQKSGLRQPHISNFLRNKRRLSLPALDRVLTAIGLSAADLIVVPGKRPRPLSEGVPLVGHETAMSQEYIASSAVMEYCFLPVAAVERLRAGPVRRGIQRERFVAIVVSEQQAEGMRPVLHAGSLAIIDRHSLQPVGQAAGERHIYAVRYHGGLHLFYVSAERNFLVLRPHAAELPLRFLRIPLDAHVEEYVVGRVCAVLAVY
jgi:transcriptional regulator with XRE-family HTH domain